MNVNIHMGVSYLVCLSLLLIVKVYDKNSQVLKIDEKFCDNPKYYENNELTLVPNTTQQIKVKKNVNNYLNTTADESSFVLFAYLPKIQNLQLTILSSTTDALIAVPIVTTFITVGINFASELSKSLFIQQSASSLVGKKSLQFTIVKGIITTEIVTKLLKLITKPVIAEYVTSVQIRKENFKLLNNKMYYLISKFLIQKCDGIRVINILKHYCFATPKSLEMYILVKSIYENGYPAENYDKSWLSNPKLYEKLRFDSYLEDGFLRAEFRNEAIQRIYNIYSDETNQLIKMDPEYLIDNYLTHKLFDMITFDDYYAIKTYLINNFSTTNIKNPIFWRIKKALYSLVTRQFDLISFQTKKTMFCRIKNKLRHEKTQSFIIKDFTLCHEHYSDAIHYNTRTVESKKKVQYKNILKVRMSLQFVVNLKYIFPNLNQFIIFPGNKFLVIDTEKKIHKGVFSHVTTIKHLPSTLSEHLAKVANSASLYADKISGNRDSESFRRLQC